MVQNKDKVTIKDIKVLGSYNKMFHDTETYPHTLKKLAKDVKKHDITAIAIAALLLSQILTPNAILVPIPQSSGKADYTLKLANTIKVIRQDCQVIDMLCGDRHEKLYDIKKSNPKLEGIDFSMRVRSNINCKRTLKNNSNVYLLDNVLNTGFTFNQAKKALKKYIDIEPSLLAISATSNWIS